MQKISAHWQQLDSQAFASLKQGVSQKLKEKPKSINEQAARYFNTIKKYRGDWQRRQDRYQALQKLTKAQVGKILKAGLAQNNAQAVDILLFAQQHHKKHQKFIEINPRAIVDIEKFKKQQRFIK
jgi:secreted Zn-dependent insulinase-like peptidase